MKKTIIILFVAGIGLLFQTCSKKEIDVENNLDTHHSLISVKSGVKDSGETYLMSTRVGHRSSECGGRCIALWGKPCHIDCMGHGHYCAQLAYITLHQTSTAVTATTVDTFDLTSEDFFLMPDRSLNYTDENNNRIFLNIPEQLVYRDSTTLQFTFTGLYFTNTPAYDNND